MKKKVDPVYVFKCPVCRHLVFSSFPIYASPCPVCGKSGMFRVTAAEKIIEYYRKGVK